VQKFSSALELKLMVYDAIFLVLIEEKNNRLITADRILQRAAKKIWFRLIRI